MGSGPLDVIVGPAFYQMLNWGSVAYNRNSNTEGKMSLYF
jgi:hypothetical protein